MGDFFAFVDLPVGDHQFKYFVDNEWTNDKNLPTVDNQHGSKNNVISILNKDTPLSCEPTLLPEPNHVMINHLYAMSIKDGVMVISSTQRFRKKYVTTILYKPIEP